VQRLPPRQRAVLILRDVLGFTASEAAQILGVSEESVTSALKCARATMRSGLPDRYQHPPAPESAGEKQLIDRLIHAYETGDVAAIIALFTDDAWLAMPSAPLEYQGRDRIAEFLKAIAIRAAPRGPAPGAAAAGLPCYRSGKAGGKSRCMSNLGEASSPGRGSRGDCSAHVAADRRGPAMF
jgi:hypothetical protein